MLMAAQQLLELSASRNSIRIGRMANSEEMIQPVSPSKLVSLPLLNGYVKQPYSLKSNAHVFGMMNGDGDKDSAGSLEDMVGDSGGNGLTNGPENGTEDMSMEEEEDRTSHLTVSSRSPSTSPPPNTLEDRKEEVGENPLALGNGQEVDMDVPVQEVVKEQVTLTQEDKKEEVDAVHMDFESYGMF